MEMAKEKCRNDGRGDKIRSIQGEEKYIFK